MLLNVGSGGGAAAAPASGGAAAAGGDAAATADAKEEEKPKEEGKKSSPVVPNAREIIPLTRLRIFRKRGVRRRYGFWAFRLEQLLCSSCTFPGLLARSRTAQELRSCPNSSAFPLNLTKHNRGDSDCYPATSSEHNVRNRNGSSLVQSWKVDFYSQKGQSLKQFFIAMILDFTALSRWTSPWTSWSSNA